LLRDPCYISGVHLTWARREDEANCISAEFGGPLCILEVGVRADLDPHGGLDIRRIFAIEQKGERGGGVGLTHQRFTDEEGIVSNSAQSGNIVG